MSDADKHWRYALAAMLIVASFTLGMVCVFQTIPEGNQRLLDALFGGLITITGNAVLKAIDGARAIEDAATIKSQSDQLAGSSPTAAVQDVRVTNTETDPVPTEPQS